MQKTLVILIAIGLVLGIGYFGFRTLTKQTKNQNKAANQTPSPTQDPNVRTNWTEKKFKNLNLTFDAPANLTIEESELEGQPTASIQNDKIGSEFFQMYFTHQTTGKKVSQADIQTFKNDPKLIIPGTARDVSIDGYPGFAGQVNDKRKRFITALVKDGYWLIIYTAESTQANKELSDNIMSTFKFTK